MHSGWGCCCRAGAVQVLLLLLLSFPFLYFTLERIAAALVSRLCEQCAVQRWELVLLPLPLPPPLLLLLLLPPVVRI